MSLCTYNVNSRGRTVKSITATSKAKAVAVAKQAYGPTVSVRKIQQKRRR